MMKISKKRVREQSKGAIELPIPVNGREEQYVAEKMLRLRNLCSMTYPDMEASYNMAFYDDVFELGEKMYPTFIREGDRAIIGPMLLYLLNEDYWSVPKKIR